MNPYTVNTCNIKTLNSWLYCYHPYGNTIIVIAFRNIIVVVYVVNTQDTLLNVCRCGSELQMNSLHC